ncbi:MAG: hypothetical protein ACD_38C00206G0004 [uncultured bacterium]|uniref:Type II toxin-antitoxin system RelE/ParE family toxin n=1 Tax=Candidatus Daviesbacteria bacterium GW2011_GWC2_40_12 TaxID=1618431 RepID=A0A0G0T2H1_9BACT|nr:MAG: hypothetical protein ACD_38C00206G0004 [uncultured bacterium]KKQ82921.1 MAG: hypothetical protein UT04_C0043G0010 [Candidatus Daviesbacteria bacterium GW2011_GWF2_38_7]KKR15567.1 MAG: hypothetical protein UT45_C0018G0007 [Candidatus Daviesbacteria bacterium GW2011_GWA2_39_33]KKR24149.1 MAG: hypothetical protein UT54_C0028G0007 [Candidatus Daviesbacteria bacterium GW2011_GWB1_39_5]KKR41290.1 MAG: hypothetical protein UT77_C0015G0038 [Candidatus Daviesbacteria bacterium GW2011_GWC2_40_12]
MEVKTLDKELEDFIYSLEKQTIAKVIKTVGLLEKFGNLLTLPHSKKLYKNLFELRIRGAQEVRIFYAFHKNQAVLLHGFIKKSQKTPLKELNLALKKLKSLT